MMRSALLLCLLFSTLLQAQNKADEKEWIQLFNGRDLTGWIPKITGYPAGENFGNTFRVENGVFKVSYDQYKEWGSRFGHIFYKDPFSSMNTAQVCRFDSHYLLRGPA